jgi:L-ribulose-5-phosphate 3-epimerase
MPATSPPARRRRGCWKPWRIPNLKVVWDPANAYVSGETPFPDGYRRLPVERIAHVHAKDCRVEGHRPIWCALGEGGIDWKGQIRALADDGYKGWISLETHWQGPAATSAKPA